MNFSRKSLIGAVGIAVAATSVFAASHVNPAVEGAIKARHAHMQLSAHNLGILGAMAKGEMDYDAEAAGAAASNLAAVVQLSQRTYWPEGSDTSVEGSRALPKIWEDMADFESKNDALVEAAMTMEGAAGTDLAALQGAMGPLGKACGSCHETYRQSDN